MSDEAGFGREELLAFLARNEIPSQTVDHAPTFRVSDGAELKTRLSGAHTKNLFLKDAKDRLWLVSALADARIDLKRLPAVLGAARLSFGSEDRLVSALGVRPGSVSAFALVNDPGRKVTLVVDRALFKHETLNFHPLRNDATTSISTRDFRRFLAVLGREPILVDFP